MILLIEVSPYMIPLDPLKRFFKEQLNTPVYCPQSLGQFKSSIEKCRGNSGVIINSMINIFNSPNQSYQGERLPSNEVKLLYAIMLKEALTISTHPPIIINFNSKLMKKLLELRTTRTVARIIQDILEVKIFYSYAYEEYPILPAIKFQELKYTTIELENQRRIRKCLFCMN